MRRLLPALLLALLVAPTAADFVVLNSGKIYEGSVSRKGDLVIVEIRGGQIELNAADVREIVPAAATQPSVATTQDAPTTAPATDIAESRSIPISQAQMPETMAFAFMRRLADVEPGTATFDIRTQIDQWRSAAHDRVRKVGPYWKAPKEFQQGRKVFLIRHAETVETLRRMAQVRGNQPDKQAQRRVLAQQAGKQMLSAAQVWTDPLLRTFLTGVASYESANYGSAEADFRECCRQAPLVAAFHQGRGMALGKLTRHLDALEACTRVAMLEPDSREAVELLREGIKNVPGFQIGTEVFLKAKQLADTYENTTMPRGFSPRAARWLLPGKVQQGRDGSLPVLAYDRLVFRQAVGLPIAKHTLLVDSAAVDGATVLYVRISADTVAPAKLKPAPYSTGGSKDKPLLALVTVSDYEFSPVELSPAPAVEVGQMVTFYALGIFTDMGSALTAVVATVREPRKDGMSVLSESLLPGEGATPVLTSDGRLVAFITGRTAADEMDAGASKPIALSDLEPLVKRAGAAGASASTFGAAKREVTIQAASGRVFAVYAIECETLD